MSEAILHLHESYWVGMQEGIDQGGVGQWEEYSQSIMYKMLKQQVLFYKKKKILLSHSQNKIHWPEE